MGTVKAQRVLVLGSVLDQGYGGVWRHNRELLPRAAALLSAAGGSLAVLEGREPCAFPLPDEVERIPSRTPSRPALSRALAEGHALRRVLEDAKAQGRPFDLVHTAHQPVPRGFGTPVSLLIHDLRSMDLKHSPFSRRLFSREIIGGSIGRAAVLSAVSQAVADELAMKFKFAGVRIHIISNAADHFEPLPRQGLDGAPLLCVGHLEPRKNQQLLLEALAADPALPDVHFVGAAKGAEEQRLREYADRLAVRDRVRFLGPVDDDRLRQLLAEARAVVLPSQLEGFGIVALEAIQAEVPLALSAIPAHLEVAPDAPHFIDKPDACAAAIHAALKTSPEDLRRFASEARSRFSWDESAARLVAAWSSI